MDTKKLQKYNLTDGKVWKIMLQFAMPIFLGTLFQSLYTTADAIIIGRFAGKEALAAIESVFTLTKMPINFFPDLHQVQRSLFLNIMVQKRIKRCLMQVIMLCCLLLSEEQY